MDHAVILLQMYWWSFSKLELQIPNLYSVDERGYDLPLQNYFVDVRQFSIFVIDSNLYHSDSKKSNWFYDSICFMEFLLYPLQPGLPEQTKPFNRTRYPLIILRIKQDI